MPINPGVIPLITDNVWKNINGLGQLRDGIDDLKIDQSTTFLDQGNRIYADLSNATISNRLLFQTYVSNSYTSFGLIPSGTHDTSVFSVFNNVDPDNASNGSLSIDSTSLTLQSGRSGTGSYLPLRINTGGSERITLGIDGFIGINETNPQTYLDINGDIRIQDIAVPTTTTNKLYATGGNLYWNTEKLNASSGSQNLSEVLTQGNSAGSTEIDMNGNKVINVDTPTSAGDATTKSYVDIQDVSTLNSANTYTDTISASFITLTDVIPNSYTGEALKIPQVTSGETALEFTNSPVFAGLTVSNTISSLSTFTSTNNNGGYNSFFDGANFMGLVGFGESMFGNDGATAFGIRSLNDMMFATSGNNIRMTIDGTSGNIGIGTTDPIVKLEIINDETIKIGPAFFGGANAGASELAHMSTNAWYNGAGWIFPGATAGALIQMNDDKISFFSHDGAGAFFQSLALAATGNSTFGNSTNRQIEINPSTGTIFLNGSVGGWAEGYHFRGSSGTDRGGFGALGSVDNLTYYYIGPSYTSPYMVVNGVGLGIGDTTPNNKIDINTTSTNSGINLDGQVALSGYSGNGFMRLNGSSQFTSGVYTPGYMRIDDGLGLGTNNGTYQLYLTLNSAAKPASSTWTVISDERIKENIELANIDRCYEIVKELPLKKYAWKYYDEKAVNDRNMLGWVAQDVQKVFPKAVMTVPFNIKYEEMDDEGNIAQEAEVIEDALNLDADQITKALYGAVQKMQQVIEGQQEIINDLTIRIETLEGV